MTRQVFDTAQVAHIWAQGRQAEGCNSGRRVFFEGPRLFSYGRHFLTAFLLPDGAAFLNSDRYSVSTSRHQSDARHATRGRRLPMPGNQLEQVAAILESQCFEVESWIWGDGFESDSPYGHATLARSEAIKQKRPANAAELKEARARLESLFLKAKEAAPAESIAAALVYAGAKPEGAAKAAARIVAAHIKREAEEAAKAAKDKRDSNARYAKKAAATPLSDLPALFEKGRAEFRKYNWRGAEERAIESLQEESKALFRGIKEAKARGWNQIAAAAQLRRKAIQKEIQAFPQFARAFFELKEFRESVALCRAGLVELNQERPGAFGESDCRPWFERKKAAAELLALFGFKEGAPGLGRLAKRARLVGADLARMGAGLQAMESAFEAEEAKARAGSLKAARLQEVAELRAFKVAGAGADLKAAQGAVKVAGRYATQVIGGRDFGGKIPGAFRLAGFTGAAFRDIKKAASERAAFLLVEAEKARAAAAAAAAAKEAEKRAAALDNWRDFEGPLPYRASDARGGALLRAHGVRRDASGQITGGLLDTSHGAQVPLVHAIRAFRFIALCRAKGKAWAANGKTLPVGHFRVDSISAAGDFRAGCHTINWPEVAALAARLGLSDLAPADTTEESAHA